MSTGNTLSRRRLMARDLATEFAEDYRHVHVGMGGGQEDHVFFDTLADI